MYLPSLILTFLAAFGLVTSTVFAGMVVAGARKYLRERRAEGLTHPGGTPPLSLLKPLHGAEPGLAAHLATFFEQDYPVFEILFCTRDENDPALLTAREVAARYPHVPVKFLSTGGNPPYINAKVASLEKMTAAAAHEILVISDSDVRVDRQYLHAVAQPFADPKVGGMTCLYRGVARRGDLWARLEAVGMSVEMTAGVVVANMLEGMRFALGPTMAVRRECVTAMGGMRVLGDYCSDDYLLGNAVYEQGRVMVLSHHVIDHMILNTSFAGSLKHQARWMKSTRFSRPKGHLGTGLIFSMPFGLLGLASATGMHRPLLGAALLLWALASRWMIAWFAGRKVVLDRSLTDLLILYPLRDLMGFGFWAASYTSNRILWRGESFLLTDQGRMIRASEPTPGILANQPTTLL